MIEIPNLRGKELFKFLVENKAALEAQKKMVTKEADSVFYGLPQIGDDRIIKGIASDKTELSVTSVINTTYWYDSHGDVHIDGLWKKSLTENRQLLLLQEHSMSFKGIISDQVKAYIRNLSWKSLGVDASGNTEALIFESVVKEKRNPYMFEQYKDGNVKNHSVGMRYVHIKLAINSEEEDLEAYKTTWDKYYDKIANKADVDQTGWFWAVIEAKVVEGSAVPIGSNVVTPTQEIKNIEPVQTTQQIATQKRTIIRTELNNLLKQFQ